MSYLGYEPQAVAVGNRTSFDITLREAASEIESVVVTALGIKRSEKALSYNAQQINAEDIVAVKDVNFVNSLNGKVAGLNINASSSGVGGSSKVVMRGSKSIEQSSNALYVIDGIPMCNFRSDGSEEFDSQGSSEAIADLNPEDIESMTVLSGAAAAALYGSDAANGAILITTKRGKAGQTTVTVTSNTEVLAPFVMPMFQTRYGTGDKLAGAANGIYSWGERLNAFNYRGYDPSDDYFQTGVVGTETVSFSTGNEKNQTYISASTTNTAGIIPENTYDRYNFTARNTTSFAKDKLVLDLGASFIIQHDENMVTQGKYYNPLPALYLFPRSDDFDEIRLFERWDPVRGYMVQYWPYGEGAHSLQNPYWIQNRMNRETSKRRYMLNASLRWNITDWMNVSGRVRVDNSEYRIKQKLYASTLTTFCGTNGGYEDQTQHDRSFYGDVMLNIDKTFGDDWTLNANIGASINDQRLRAGRRGGRPAADQPFRHEQPQLSGEVQTSAGGVARPDAGDLRFGRGGVALDALPDGDGPQRLGFAAGLFQKLVVLLSFGGPVGRGFQHGEHAQEPLLRQAACVVRIGGSGFLAFLRQSDPLVELFDQQLEPLVPKSALRPEARTHQIVRSRSYDALPQTFQFRHFVL